MNIRDLSVADVPTAIELMSMADRIVIQSEKEIDSKIRRLEFAAIIAAKRQSDESLAGNFLDLAISIGKGVQGKEKSQVARTITIAIRLFINGNQGTDEDVMKEFGFALNHNS